jgi:hypothetical protein
MKLRSLLIVTALAICLASVAFAQPYPTNGSIGVWADAAGTQCCITAAAPTTVHVLARLENATAGGITGAEFRIRMSPAPGSGWFLIWSINPAAQNTSIGNPIDDTPDDLSDPKGMNLAFPTCQPDPPSLGVVSLGTITMINAGGPPLTLEVRQKTPPANPNIPAPLLVLCDSPVFTTVPVTILQTENGGNEPIAFVARVNGTCDPASCGVVAVEEQTWSGVKGLFR